jgi:hypothetical protein
MVLTFMHNVGQLQITHKYKHVLAAKILILQICNDILMKAVWGKIPAVLIYRSS